MTTSKSEPAEYTYCSKCEQETVHEVTVTRDADDPPESFLDARDQGYASMEECTFYANGDSEYEYRCTQCGNTYEHS